MGNKDDGVWLDDLFCERLSGTEKLWRDIYRITDEFYLLVRLDRYPLVANEPQYSLKVCKLKNKKWYLIYEVQGMELQVVLKTMIRKLDKYKDDHREYMVQRPGGGEFI